MGGTIHWHEGLFLQPHHLQLFQRQIHERFDVERRLGWPYPYGVIELRVAPDALENMMVQLDRLRVIMPSGLYISLGENADLSALDIKKAFTSGSGSFVVHLGVPLWYASRANVLDTTQQDGWRAKRVFGTATQEIRDENTGENPQMVALRRINARLLLDGDDPTDLEMIPLLKILRATGDDVGLPRQDAGFVPPCLVLSGSPALRDLMRDLASQVDASRKELVLQMARGGFRVENMRGLHFEQVLRLRTLNRYSVRLVQLSQVPSISPFAMYLEMRELLGELAALYPETDLIQTADYDHDNPAPALLELSQKIRGLLRGSVKPNFLQAPFALENGVWAATLTEEHCSLPNEYFLGIKTSMDPKTLIPLAEDISRFKVMALSMAGRAIFGVKLESERVPPLELPAQTGLHYFRLNAAESARMWTLIKEEKKIAVKWPEMESADCKLTLYMTVPYKEART
ncbi:MAG: type VI secretion system baseplate subunit TssK [Lentisphaerota bacterium]